ncbi:MAG: hypothetical protein M3414_06380 [Pseudomonadota bacterium]|nr:hypothetical protein [Pseudomonadota bacterium]
MAEFNYNDIVRIRADAQHDMRLGERAWIVGVITEDKRIGSHYEQFAPGTVYAIEFEDGDSIDIDEGSLELIEGSVE